MECKLAFRKSILSSIFGVLLISSCASVDNTGPLDPPSDDIAALDVPSVGSSTSNGDVQTAVEETADSTDSPGLPAPEDDIEYGHFSEDVLTRIILAEMAGQRGLNQQALAEYHALAIETRDLNIVKRASRIATYTREVPISIEMATLWLELEPDSEEGHQTLAFQMISLGRYGQALNHLGSLLELGNNVDFRLITTRTAVDENRVLIIDPLIADFEELHLKHPENLSLFLSLAHLYQQNGQIQEAYDAVTTLAEAMNDTPEVVILEVQLLEQLGQGQQARQRLQQSLDSNSEHKQLRLLYGRKLVDEQKYDEAQEQFSIIVEQNPEDYDMLYSLALISMEVNRYNDAKRSFQRLLDNAQRQDDAHYYLAFISAQEGNDELAIEHYLQVSAGSNFLPAQRNVTELMIQKGQYTEASARLQRIRFRNPDYNMPLLTMEANVLMDEGLHDTAQPFLNSAIGAFPNNIQLLFLRSVLSQELNDLELMEADLRKVIQLNPNSPVAYNSLGYTLADRTERYEEAYELILKAFELSPEDPAIIDSLGWIQYHLGLYEEARDNLERAFELYPDHEVAAHLGEVLWVLGNTREANRVWRNALEVQPDSEFILNAMERLTSTSSI